MLCLDNDKWRCWVAAVFAAFQCDLVTIVEEGPAHMSLLYEVALFVQLTWADNCLQRANALAFLLTLFKVSVASFATVDVKTGDLARPIFPASHEYFRFNQKARLMSTNDKLFELLSDGLAMDIMELKAEQLNTALGFLRRILEGPTLAEADLRRPPAISMIYVNYAVERLRPAASRLHEHQESA